MIGTTNAIQTKILQAVLQYNNLQIWLDDTDFLNHGINNSYTITNGNNFNKLVMQTIKNNEVSTYYKSAAANRDNGIKITPTALQNYITVTMCAWAMKATEANHQNIYTCGNNSTPFLETRLRLGANNKTNYYFPNGTSYSSVECSTGITINEWVFVATVTNGTSHKYFYNGILVNEGTCGHTRNSMVNWNVLGGTCWNDGGGASYVTDYRYYDIALSDEEIMSIYEAGPQQHR